MAMRSPLQGARGKCLTVVAIPIGLATILLPTARADIPLDYAQAHSVQICKIMDRYPSLGGAMAAIKLAEYEGLNPWQADRAVRLAVSLVCPEHRGKLNGMMMT